jgi:DGQHR domain-containing protein
VTATRTTSRKKAADTVQELRLPALAVCQGENRTLISFAVDGKRLSDFATVSRLRRDEDSQLHGYQRPEALAHINAIRRYLESEDAFLPNALVVAFDKRVRFEPDGERNTDDAAQPGTLVIPIDPSWTDEDKPGWIVDGQQRSAAIREARIPSFPVFATGFITDDVTEHRSQFILVNSTKPLPKGLIYELLPTARGTLPTQLQQRRFPATLLEQLNLDPSSPLAHRIQTPTTPEGIIKDNSILRMVENSLSDGVLYRFRDPVSGAGDIAAMLSVLNAFWSAVAKVFPDAWAQPPRKSRLTHGVGIISLGFVMDAIAERLADVQVADMDAYVTGLQVLKPACHWTEGEWQFDNGATRTWNALQNTAKDIQLVADFLLSEYRASAPRTRTSAGGARV